jgi:pimeloyl-ACP methyl ester carboxylesterase
MKVRPPDRLIAGHDVVVVGYRGVDGSVKLDAPEVQRAMRGVDEDLLGPASRANFRRAIRQSAARLADEGVDLGGYTIPEVVEDLEEARMALGYERANLLSESYGTRVAQVYAAAHPDRVARSAMIGVNPPGRFVWEPAIIDQQLHHYAELYLKAGYETFTWADRIRLAP